MDSPQPAPEPSVRGLSGEDLALLNEEIAALAKAGLPLDQGLASLAEEMRHGRMRTVTLNLAADLHRGLSLPEAMAKQEGNIPRYYGRVVAAGIRTGNVGEVLATLATYGRSLAEIRWSVVSAVLYPALLFFLALGLMALIASVMSQIEHVLRDEFKIRLTVMSEIAFWLARNWLWVFVVPPAVLIGGLLAWRQILRTTEAGSVRWAKFLYGIPVIGPLFQRAQLAAFVDLLAILVRREVPMPEAFSLASEAAADPVIRVGGRAVIEDLKQGMSLGESLAVRQLMPRSGAWIIAAAERRGTLADALTNLAHMYRESVQMRTRLVGTILPPALVLGVGVIVAIFFVFGVAAPMLSLLEGLSGGSR
jgi:general secretion pathway protein F